MTKVPIDNIASLGIIKDTPAHQLPPEAWSDGLNMRFFDGKAVKFQGHSAVFDPPTVAPYWAISTATKTQVFWLYTSLTKAYGFEGGTHTEITNAGGDYSAGAALNWNGGLLAGVPVINNGVDVPQYWSTVALGTKLADLANWTAGVTCRVIRPHLAFLIALNISKASPATPVGDFPHMVKWSHPADPGSVPVSWDHTDATKDAGENDLTDVQSGIILDGLSLGRIFIIYKESSTHGMRFIGGQNIWAFFPILSLSGVLSTQCVSLTPDGKQHFVANGNDIVRLDGQNAISVVEDRQRKFIFNSIDKDNFDRSFCFTDKRFGECWFCFPEAGSTLPTLAAVWNEKDNTTTIRELSDVSFIAAGKIIETDDATWDADSGVWDDDDTAWNASPLSPFADGGLACDPTNTKLLRLNQTEQFAGTSFSAFLEREGLAIVGRDRLGNPKVDFENRKLVTRVWPKITGGPVNIRVGAQEEIGGAITYSAPKSFDPATQRYIDPDPPIAGLLMAVRFETSGVDPWALHGYDLEVSVLGKF